MMMTRRAARNTEWDFDRFSQFLKENGSAAHKLCDNTWVVQLNSDEIRVDYYTTTILAFHRDGIIDLDMGGWATVTTKERVNSFSPLSVWLENKQWYVAPDTPCFTLKTLKKQHPPIFLYDCYFARFYPDRRRLPTNAAHEPLLRRSVHERQCRLIKEAKRRNVQRAAARYRKMKKYAAWLLANTNLDCAFKDWTAKQRMEIMREMQAIASMEKASEIEELRVDLLLARGACTEADKQIAELTFKLANCTINAVGHSAVVRERVIDL